MHRAFAAGASEVRASLRLATAPSAEDAADRTADEQQSERHGREHALPQGEVAYLGEPALLRDVGEEIAHVPGLPLRRVEKASAKITSSRDGRRNVR